MSAPGRSQARSLERMAQRVDPCAQLSAQGLSFGFSQRWLFSELQIRLDPGLHWLRGPNGCGKSSLLRLLAGVLEPQRGQRWVNGIEAADQPLAYRREVFWCGPERLGFDHLSADELFAFLAGLYPRWSTARLAQVCLALHLDAAVRAQRLHTLSSGTQRKAWLAAALACGTTALLLDEPLNALDAASAAWLHEQAEQAAAHPEGRIWLVASHQAPCARPSGVIDLAA